MRKNNDERMRKNEKKNEKRMRIRMIEQLFEVNMNRGLVNFFLILNHLEPFSLVHSIFN